MFNYVQKDRLIIYSQFYTIKSMDKSQQLQNLHTKWKLECTCELRRTATQVVPGDGNANADIVFIGEAPGKKEDELGKPFVGAAGKFLNEMCRFTFESEHL